MSFKIGYVGEQYSNQVLLGKVLLPLVASARVLLDVQRALDPVNSEIDFNFVAPLRKSLHHLLHNRFGLLHLHLACLASVAYIFV